MTNKEPRAYFRKSGTFPHYEQTAEIPIFSIGQLFDDGKHFKNAITLAAVKSQRNLYFKRTAKITYELGAKTKIVIGGFLLDL